MNMPRVRFAPSPTGHLHLGNLRTALFNELFARHEKGKLILRIEDTDVERSKPEFANSILRDVDVMGIHFDEGPFYQSKRLHHYEEALHRLEASGRTYFCYCTQEELKARRREALQLKKPPRYDNRCRTLSPAEAERRKSLGMKPTIRFRVDEEQPILVEDLIRGVIHFPPEEIGDFVIMRTHPFKDGEWLPTFHLSVCVDDGLMGITHVIRGEDHLSNSPRHVLLFRALGFSVPKFAHLSLIHSTGGEPLSKRYGALSAVDFVNRFGYLPEALRNYLALLGWSPKDNREVFSSEELVEAFDIQNATRHPAIFAEDKLKWINGEHLRRLPDSIYLEHAFKYLKAQNVPMRDEQMLEEVLLQLKKDIHRLDELVGLLSFLEADEEHEKKLKAEFDKGEELNQVMTQGIQVLASAQQVSGALQVSGENFYDEFIRALGAALSVKGKKLFIPLRAALTGKTHGMELKRIFGLLKAPSILRRFKFAAQMSSPK